MSGTCYALLVALVALPQALAALWPGLGYCPACGRLARNVQHKEP